jgi:hypothetical protein
VTAKEDRKKTNPNDLRSAEVISPDWDEVVSSFDDMGLDEKLLNSELRNK